MSILRFLSDLDMWYLKNNYSLNYAYGNLKLAQSPEEADEFYNKARIILEETTPYHLLLAACLYKLACLRAQSGDRLKAL